MLLKAILANVTALITQPHFNQPHPGSGFQLDANMRTNGPQGPRRQQDPTNLNNHIAAEPSQLTIDDLEALRSREITSKAVSGILLMLLKWFKVSRLLSSLVSLKYVSDLILDILKFEYFTQLLLDSNYLPLVLKLYAHQDIDRLVDIKYDREDLRYDFYLFSFVFISTNLVLAFSLFATTVAFMGQFQLQNPQTCQWMTRMMLHHRR